MVCRGAKQYYILAMRIAVLIFCQALTLCAADEFRLRPSVEDIPERGKVSSYILLCQGSQISFIPPLDAELVKTDEKTQTVNLQPFNGGYTLTLTVLTNLPTTNGQALAEQEGRRFTGGRLLDFTTAYTGSGAAPQAEWIYGTAPTVLRTRMAFLTVDGRVVAVSLTGNSDEFSRLLPSFANFLNTVKVIGRPRSRPQG